MRTRTCCDSFMLETNCVEFTQFTLNSAPRTPYSAFNSTLPMGTGQMLFEVLQLSDGGPRLCHSSLDPQQLALLPFGRDDESSRILVLRIEDLNLLLQSLPRGFILDRGTKHRAKA